MVNYQFLTILKPIKTLYLHVFVLCTTKIRWRCHGILDWTLDSGSKGCEFDSRQCLALFVLQQDTLSTLLLSTQVYKWVPGRMRTLFVAWCGNVYTPEVAPGQNALCLSVGLILNPVTGVIIHCKVLWVVSHTRKALYRVAQKECNYFDP